MCDHSGASQAEYITEADFAQMDPGEDWVRNGLAIDISISANRVSTVWSDAVVSGRLLIFT